MIKSTTIQKDGVKKGRGVIKLNLVPDYIEKQTEERKTKQKRKERFYL